MKGNTRILHRLGYDDETIIPDYLKSKYNLYDRLAAYVKEHPDVELATLIPREENIRAVLERLKGEFFMGKENRMYEEEMDESVC